MTKKAIALVIAYIFVSFSYAASKYVAFELQGRQKLSQGEPFEARMHFVNFKMEELQAIEKKEENFLNDNIYLAKINSLNPSPNNADVITLDGLFVLINKPRPSASYIEVNKKPYEISWTEVKIKATKQQGRNILFFNYKLNKDYWWVYIIAGLVLILVITTGGMLFYRQMKKKKQKEKEQEEQLYWENKIKNAEDREDYEYLFSHRKSWQPIFQLGPMERQQYEDVMKDIIYRPIWQAKEKEKARRAVDNIMRDQV